MVVHLLLVERDRKADYAGSRLPVHSGPTCRNSDLCARMLRQVVSKAQYHIARVHPLWAIQDLPDWTALPVNRGTIVHRNAFQPGTSVRPGPVCSQTPLASLRPYNHSSANLVLGP